MKKYDYSKYNDPDWSDDWVYKESKEEGASTFKDDIGWPSLDDSMDKEYWGIHEVNGRLEIDLRRFEYVCYRMYEHDYFPKALIGRGGYYIASKEHRHDYTCNFLNDSVSELNDDWFNEYKPLFKKIYSPNDAEEAYRTSAMCTVSSADDYDSAILGSKWAAIQRMNTYDRILTELHCIFLTKIVIEIHRIILRALSMELYEKPDYNVWDLVTYCNGSGVKYFSIENARVYLKYNPT